MDIGLALSMGPSVRLSILSHNKVTNGWNFMKLILNIYDHGEVITYSFIGMSQLKRSYCLMIS